MGSFQVSVKLTHMLKVCTVRRVSRHSNIVRFCFVGLTPPDRSVTKALAAALRSQDISAVMYASEGFSYLASLASTDGMRRISKSAQYFCLLVGVGWVYVYVYMRVLRAYAGIVMRM